MKKNNPSTKLLLTFLFIGFLSLFNNNIKAQTCNASFSYNTGSNGVVYFYNTSTSTDSLTYFYWTFGNGQVGTTENPVVTYVNVGVYNVCLVVGAYNQSCYDTICQQVAITNVNCNVYAWLDADSIAGTMTANVMGGTGPYTYQWSTGETTTVINPTSIGTYSLTVTDAFGCSYTAYYFWNGLNCNIGYTYNSPTQGTVNFYTAGTGGQPVTWDFGDGTMPFTTAATYFTHTFAQSGNYYVCITMGNNCQPYCQYINVTAPMPCSGVSTNIVSLQNNTFLLAEVFNANLPVSYQWTSGDTSQGIPTNGISTFCVTITDALGCTASDCITVNPNCNMTVTLDTLTNPFGVTPTVTNGVAPYTYQWSNGSTASVIYPVQAGQYCLTVTDAMGCSATACTWSNGNQNCNFGFTMSGPNQGTVGFFAYNTMGSTITWNFGDGSQTVTNPALQATHTYQNSGTYYVCMSILNCPVFCDTVVINLGNPCANMTALVTAFQNNTWLTVSASGGTWPYTYQWTTGDTAAGIPTQMGTSTYCVTATDALGCTATDCIVINPNCNLTVNIFNDSLAGIMTAYATNGNAPFTYSWTNGSNQQVISPTLTGNYCVTVTDAVGCSATNCAYWYGNNNCNYGFTYTYQGPGQIVFITYGTNGQTVTWNFGDGTAPQTSSLAQLMHTYAAGGYYTVSMSISGCNTVYMTVFVNIPGSSVICGNIFNDNNNNSVIDAGDTGIDSAYVYIWGGSINQTGFTDAAGNYSFNNLPAGTYNVEYCLWYQNNWQGSIITVPSDTGSCAIYTITVGANDTICDNNFGVYNNASEVSGTVFLDANNNGVMDGNETGLAYQLVYVGGYYLYTDWYGNFNAWLAPGNYTVSFTPSSNYSSGTITTPTSYQINVTGPGLSYDNNNFGIYLPPGMNDLSISITPSTTVTPGFPAWYSINVCNYGATATGATVTMIYDPALVPYSQSPAGVVNMSNQTITWNIANINPNSCAYIWVDFDALTSIQLGAGTFEFVMVNPTSGIDNNLANNTDSVHQTIIGSWDPNNKIVVKSNNPADPSTQYISSVNPNQEITYTINFQNTGNAPAHNVVIIDEMANELDLNSYQFVNSSHNCDVVRVGNTVTYRFMDIMLADSTNDEPNSHGFVTFKVNAISGLPIGTQIIDFANIYFDFNAPVLTNDAVVTLIDVTGVSNKDLSNVVIYPNPTKENFNLIYNCKVNGSATLVIYDNVGKKVFSKQEQVLVGQNKNTINTQNFESGLYFVELIQPDGTILKNRVSIQK